MRNIVLFVFILFICSNCRNINHIIYTKDLLVYYKLDNYFFVTKRSDIIKTYKDMQYDINDEMLFDVLSSSKTNLLIKHHLVCKSDSDINISLSMSRMIVPLFKKRKIEIFNKNNVRIKYKYKVIKGPLGSVYFDVYTNDGVCIFSEVIALGE